MWREVTAAVLVGLATPALAAEVDTQLLNPSFTPESWLGHPGTVAQRAGRVVSVGATLIVERRPMVVFPHVGDPIGLVAGRLSVVPGVFVAPHQRFGLGLSIPILGQQGDWPAHPVPRVGIGDLRLELLANIVDAPEARVAFVADASFPTHTRQSLHGETTPRTTLGVAAELLPGRFRVLVAAAARLRKPVSTGYDFDLNPELALDLGLRFDPLPDVVGVIAQLHLRGGFAHLGRGAAENPAEVRIGVRLGPPGGLRVDIATGFGLNAGYGAPRARVILGVRSSPPPPKPPPGAVIAALDEDDDPTDDIGDLGPTPDPTDHADTAPPTDPTADDAPPEQGSPRAQPEPPSQPEAPKATPLPGPIRFAKGSSALDPAALRVLGEALDVIDAHPHYAYILVEGHASAEGGAALNWDLSLARSLAATKHLVEAGVDPRRIVVRGMGEVLPPSPRDADEVVEDERRVELHLVHQYDGWFEEIPNWADDAPPVPWTGEPTKGDAR